MNEAFGQALFYLSAVMAITGALGTVASRSAIRSAMSLLLTVVGIAGLFLTLSAQLLAAVQVIVYAGAVVVLFAFVVMLLGGAAELGRGDQTLRTRAVAVVLTLVGAVVTLVLVLRAGGGKLHEFGPARVEFGSVHALGRTLFTDGVAAFEVTGVLLLVAIVGAMALARTRRSPPAAPSGGADAQGEEVTS